MNGASGGSTKKGIVVVHGVGAARQSDTILDLGKPLLDWVQRWMAVRGREARYERAGLPFGTLDDPRTPPAHVTLRVDGGAGAGVTQPDTSVTWVMAEAWWAASSRRSGVAPIVGWVVDHLWNDAQNLARVLAERCVRLVTPKEDSTDPAFWARGIDLINSLLLLFLFFPLALVGVVAGLALAVLAQLPIPGLHSFIVFRVLRGVLTANIGEMRTLLTDEVQAAAMRERVYLTIEYLVGQGCDEISIVAHSGGVVVAYEALSRPDRPDLVAKVTTFFSLGEGLNQAWLLAERRKLALDDQERMLGGALPAHIAWLDFWGSYDPVPEGALRPPRGVNLIAPPDPLQPGAAPLAPASLQVTNRMSTLTDHGGYWQNDEQVLSRIAQQIDAGPGRPYTASAFWPGDEAQHRAVRHRRRRVSILAGMRLWTGVLLLTTLAARWDHLAPLGSAWWGALSQVPGVRGLFDGAQTMLLGLFGLLHMAVQTIVPAVATAFVDTVLLGVLGALLYGLIVLGLYQVGLWLVWDRWDQHERLCSLQVAGTPREGQGRWWPQMAGWAAVLAIGCVALGAWLALLEAVLVMALAAALVGAVFTVGRVMPRPRPAPAIEAKRQR